MNIEWSLEREDNGQPKRPPNAFMLFCKDNRHEVLSTEIGHSSASLARRLAEIWNNLDQKVKLQYQRKASSLQKEFKEKYPEYKYYKNKDCLSPKVLNEQMFEGIAHVALDREDIQYVFQVGVVQIMRDMHINSFSTDALEQHRRDNKTEETPAESEGSPRTLEEMPRKIPSISDMLGTYVSHSSMNSQHLLSIQNLIHSPISS